MSVPVISAESISSFDDEAYFNTCNYGERLDRWLMVAGMKRPPCCTVRAEYSCIQNGIALLTAPPESTGAASILNAHH